MDSLPRRLFLSLLAVALFLALLEGVLSWTYAIAKTREPLAARKRPEHRHAKYDPTLGWVNEPGAFVRDAYGPGKHFTTNQQGFRAREEYPREVPAGRKRVLFAGDSFTMGFGVGDADTYPAQIEHLDPRIQSANLGMGAYGVDQAWLSLRSPPAQIDHDLAVLAFIAHDFRRMELDFYMAPKPRLTQRKGELVIENAPVPERSAKEDARFALREFFTWLDLGKALGRLARGLAPKQEESPAPFAPDARSFPPLARALFAELARDAAQRRVPVLLAYLPTRDDFRHGKFEIRDWTQREAAKAGLPYFDAVPAFARAPELDALYLEDGHFSEAGNAVVAEAMQPVLRELLGLAAPEIAPSE